MGSVADELITRGWTQGYTVDYVGRVCLLGAVGYIVDPEKGMWIGPEFSAYVIVMKEMLRHQGPVAFNDNPDRTMDEVIRFAKEVDEVMDYLKELKANGD